MSDDYKMKWEDLPADVVGGIYPLNKYDVPRRWGTKTQRYSRTMCFRIAVNAEQHARLKGTLARATIACRELVADLTNREMTGAPFERAAGATFMEGLGRALTGEGAIEGTEREGVLKAAAHTLRASRGYLLQKQIPRLPYSLKRDLADGLPVRICAGTVYRAPIRREREWIKLGDLSWVAAPDAPEGENAAYAEYTFWDQTWQVRFVFCEIIPKEG